jgi:HSP20 family protein
MTRTLLPWNARGGNWFDAVRREMDELVTRLQDVDNNEEFAAFSPRTNVAETKDSYEISLDVPGMKADDFNIELHEGRLSIWGERQREEEKADKTFHRVERYYGKFRRTFALGQDVDADRVEAAYRDGVLTLTVPKTEKAQPKKIEIRS